MLSPTDRYPFLLSLELTLLFVGGSLILKWRHHAFRNICNFHYSSIWNVPEDIILQTHVPQSCDQAIPHTVHSFSPCSQIMEPFDRILSSFHSIQYTSFQAITHILTVLSTCRILTVPQCYLLNHSPWTSDWWYTPSESFRLADMLN
jgi:hypothetical protein